MSINETQSIQINSSANFVIETHQQTWVIPNNATMMKLLMEDQSIRPRDLRFASPNDCKLFIRRMMLLALKDETKNFQPSPLAKFARDLLKNTQTTTENVNPATLITSAPIAQEPI